MIDKSKSCCFTGHRLIKESDYSLVTERLYEEIIGLINLGFENFLAGGALGFDTEAALMVLKLQIKYQHIKLILVLPCKNQADSWKDEDVKLYKEIIACSDECIYTSELYEKGCMHKRNRSLVDNSSVCIAYLNKKSGGTAYTVDYAKKNDVKVVILNDMQVSLF